MKNYIITSNSKILAEIVAENISAAQARFLDKYRGDEFCFDIREIAEEKTFFYDFTLFLKHRMEARGETNSSFYKSLVEGK